jgi:hypothetical protein
MLKHNGRIKEQFDKNGSNLLDSVTSLAVFLQAIYSAKFYLCYKGLGLTMRLLFFLFLPFICRKEKKGPYA